MKNSFNNKFVLFMHLVTVMALVLFWTTVSIAQERVVYHNVAIGIVEHSTVVDGKRHGAYAAFSMDNGAKVAEGAYVNDKMTGKFRHYYPNGKLRLEFTAADGQLTGPYSFYYESGQLRGQGTTYGSGYCHGAPPSCEPLKTGLWITCDVSGNITDATNYVKNVAVGKATVSAAASRVCNVPSASKAKVMQVSFVRQTIAGFEPINRNDRGFTELVYNQPFYIEALFDTPPAEIRKEIRLEWAAGQTRNIVVTKTEKDPRVFRSEVLFVKAPQ